MVDSKNNQKYVSDNQIVPEDVQNRLMHWRSVSTAVAFDIGDVANDLCIESVDRGLPVTNKRVYAAVGRFCGKSGRTVRYYAECSSFFPQSVRDEFDHLSFSHFVFAKTLDGRWMEVLEYASNKPQISVEELRFSFANQGDQDEFDRILESESEEPCARPEETGEGSPLLSSGNGRGHRTLSMVSRLAEAVDECQLAIDEGAITLTEPDRAALESAFEVIREKVPVMARSGVRIVV